MASLCWGKASQKVPDTGDVSVFPLYDISVALDFANGFHLWKFSIFLTAVIFPTAFLSLSSSPSFCLFASLSPSACPFTIIFLFFPDSCSPVMIYKCACPAKTLFVVFLPLSFLWLTTPASTVVLAAYFMLHWKQEYTGACYCVFISLPSKAEDSLSKKAAPLMFGGIRLNILRHNLRTFEVASEMPCRFPQICMDINIMILLLVWSNEKCYYSVKKRRKKEMN